MKNHATLFIVFWLMTVLTACQDGESPCPPDLPCATEIGAEIFACYVNGEPWVAHVPDYFIGPYHRETLLWYDETHTNNFHNNSFAMRAERSDTINYQYFYIDFEGLTPETTIITHQENDIWAGFISQPTYADNRWFKMDTLYDHEIIITRLDTVANILSGTFHFRAIDAANMDTIYVTEGRFDKVYFAH